MPILKKNKLNIYLIKAEVNPTQIIVAKTELKRIKSDGMEICIQPSHIRKPNWIENFFGSLLSEHQDIFSSVPSAAIVIPVKIKNIVRTFVLTFGTGFHLIQKGAIEERFGLKVVLNAVDQKNIRSIDKKNLGALAKQTKEQAGRSAETKDFGIDIEQDLLQAVTGTSMNSTLGKTISGKDSLHLSVSYNINNIRELLQICYEYSESTKYKENFSWIDYISEIKDPNKINDLNTILLSKINSEDSDRLWMSIPEVIDWTDFESFQYKTGANAKKYADLSIVDFIEEHQRLKGEFTVENIRNFHTYCMFENTPDKSWRAYDCIYTEITKDGKLYTLTNAKWYEVNKSFSDRVNQDYIKLLSKKPITNLPACPVRHDDHTKAVVEDTYNKYSSELIHAALLDRKTVMHSGSPIEVCDLFTNQKEFFHIKHYGGSNVLSHLFNQGIVSAELFAMEGGYRKAMNDKIAAEDLKLGTPEDSISTKDYSVVYGIISNKQGSKLDIPFFSKVSLRNTINRLNLYGYKAFVQKINIDPSKQL